MDITPFYYDSNLLAFSRETCEVESQIPKRPTPFSYEFEKWLSMFCKLTLMYWLESGRQRQRYID